jgi:hypothetical protein
VQFVCREDNVEQLLTQLGTYLLDVVIASAPAPAYLPIKGFNHLVGESDIALFAPTPLASASDSHGHFVRPASPAQVDHFWPDREPRRQRKPTGPRGYREATDR